MTDRPIALVAWREIREATRARSFRISVVLSAVARERPVGAAAFLRKPIPLQKFFDTIKGFVEAGLPRPTLA